jgi:hypothetical protein
MDSIAHHLEARTTHTNAPDLICADRATALEAHVRSIPNKTQPHPCPACINFFYPSPPQIAFPQLRFDVVAITEKRGGMASGASDA